MEMEHLEYDPADEYDKMRDDESCALSEEIEELVARYFNGSGYYHQANERLFEHITQSVGRKLGFDISFKRVGKSFKRIEIKVR